MLDTNRVLVDAIVSFQQEKGFSDGGLAALLGIDRSTLSYIKRGQRKPGGKFLGALAQAVPELQTHIMKHLLRGNGQGGQVS